MQKLNDERRAGKEEEEKEQREARREGEAVKENAWESGEIATLWSMEREKTPCFHAGRGACTQATRMKLRSRLKGPGGVEGEGRPRQKGTFFLFEKDKRKRLRRGFVLLFFFVHLQKVWCWGNQTHLCSVPITPKNKWQQRPKKEGAGWRRV